MSLGPNATALGRGDLNFDFSVAVTQLMTLEKSLFPLWPVIHRIRRLSQKALKPRPVLIHSKPSCPLPLPLGELLVTLLSPTRRLPIV